MLYQGVVPNFLVYCELVHDLHCFNKFTICYSTVVNVTFYISCFNNSKVCWAVFMLFYAYFIIYDLFSFQ